MKNGIHTYESIVGGWRGRVFLLELLPLLELGEVMGVHKKTVFFPIFFPNQPKLIYMNIDLESVKKSF